MGKDARTLPNAMKTKIPAMKLIKTPKQIVKHAYTLTQHFIF